MDIRLTQAERQSGWDRQNMAESLILQLPVGHDGRNTWLLNYGRTDEAFRMRGERGLRFDTETQAAETTR